jgi:hypothetical protein
VEVISRIEERRREPDLFMYGHPTDAIETPIYLFFPPPAHELTKMINKAFLIAQNLEKKRKKEEKR